MWNLLATGLRFRGGESTGVSVSPCARVPKRCSCGAYTRDSLGICAAPATVGVPVRVHMRVCDAELDASGEECFCREASGGFVRTRIS